MKTPTAGPARVGPFLSVIAFGALLLAVTSPAARAVSPSISPWETIVSVDSTEGAESDHFPEIIANGQTLHMAWTSDIGFDRNFLCYRRSLDGGVTWENRIVLQDYGNEWQSLQTGAATRLAVDGSHVHIVQRRLVGGWHYEIDYFRSTDGGATFEAKRTLASSDQYWWYYTPRVAAANGNVVVAFNQNPNWYYNPAGLVMISTNNGTSFTTKTVLAGTGAGCMDLRHDGNRLASIWRNQNGVWAVCSDDNGTTMNEVKLSTSTGDAQDPDPSVMRPQLCAITDDIVHMAWVQYFERTTGNWQRAVFYARSTDGGATFETARNLTEGTIGTDQVRGGGRGLMVAQGNRAYLCYVAEGGGVWLRSSGDSGAHFGDAIPLHVPGSDFAGSGDYPQMMIDPEDTSGDTAWFAFAVPSAYNGRSANVVGHTTDGGLTTDPVCAPTHPWAWGNFTPDSFRLVPVEDPAGTLWSLLYSGARPGYDRDLFFRRFEPAPDPSAANMMLHLDPATGRHDCMEIPAFPGFGANGFTVETWVRLAGGISYDRGLEILQWGPFDAGLALRSYKTPDGKHLLSAKFGTSDAQYAVGGNTALISGGWHHIAITYDPDAGANNLRFYLDGRLDASTTANGKFQPPGDPLFLGGVRSGWGLDPMRGDFENLRFWDHSLTQPEVIASAGESDVTGTESGLLAAYSFDDTTIDLTGNGNDGILQFSAGFVASSSLLGPDITVEQPAGTAISRGVTRNCGTAGIGESTSLSFSIGNSGLSWLTGLAIAKSGAHAADFTVTPLPASSLAPGGSMTFKVTFKPSVAGLRKASISLTSNDADESPFVVNLTGTGLAGPEIVVQQPAGSSLTDGTAKKSFGTVKVGKAGAPKTFTIRNTGSAKLTGLAITKNGTHAPDFVVTAPAKTSLAPGASTTFKVTFKPKAKGTRNAAIHIKSNDADENPFDIKLGGQGS